MGEKLKSRKLWAMIVAAVILILNQQVFGLSPEIIDWLVKLILGYIGVEGIADIVSRFKGALEEK